MKKLPGIKSFSLSCSGISEVSAVGWSTNNFVNGEHMAPKMSRVYRKCCMEFFCRPKKTEASLIFSSYAILPKHGFYIFQYCNEILAKVE